MNPSRRQHQIFIALSALSVVLLYLVFLFPLAHFRHDDWSIIRNATDRVAPNIWEIFNYWYDWGPVREVWFFRPFFKLLGYWYYDWFGLNYSAWLSANLICFLLAVYFCAHTLWLLTEHWARISLFAGLSLFGLHLHMGSMLWAGEGVMNCPQVTTIAASTFFFVRGTIVAAPTWRGINLILSLLCMVISFGLKEASVFHFLFLAALLRTEPRLAHASVGKPFWRVILPYAFVGGGYTIARLVLVPFNPRYAPHFSWETLVQPAVFIGGSLALPLVVITAMAPLFGLGNIFRFADRRGMLYFIPFFALSVAPYFGHAFFSPGWLLLVGLYFCFCLALWVEPRVVSGKWVVASSLVLLLASASGNFLRLQPIRWWEWHHSQKSLQQFLLAAPATTQTIVIEDCHSETAPATRLDRVVGSPAAIYDAWLSLRGTAATVVATGCAGERQISAHESDPHTLHLKWSFPELSERVR